MLETSLDKHINDGCQSNLESILASDVEPVYESYQRLSSSDRSRISIEKLGQNFSLEIGAYKEILLEDSNESDGLGGA